MATRTVYLLRHGQYHQIKDPSVTPDEPSVYGVDADEVQRDVLVCHGNLIRYFVCRILQVSLDAWVNMDTLNCGVSTIQIQPNGNCKLIAFNDTGHLPTHLLK